MHEIVGKKALAILNALERGSTPASVSDDLLDGPFVFDERIGCVAVYRGPKWNCLEGIGNTAIYYRHGTWDGEVWNVPIEYLNEAKMVCQALNAWEMIRRAV